MRWHKPVLKSKQPLPYDAPKKEVDVPEKDGDVTLKLVAAEGAAPVSQPLQWGGTWNSRRSRTRGRDESVCRQNISDDLRLSLREYLAHRV